MLQEALCNIARQFCYGKHNCAVSNFQHSNKRNLLTGHTQTTAKIITWKNKCERIMLPEQHMNKVETL